MRFMVIIIYHIDMVFRDIDMGYGLMIWEMAVSIWSYWRLIWDILSLCLGDEGGDWVNLGDDGGEGVGELLRAWAYTRSLFSST